jgi:predicted MFS family arabinose efflux permease
MAKEANGFIQVPSPKHGPALGEPPPFQGGWLLLLTLAAVQFTQVLDFIIMMPLGPIYMAQLKISPSEFGLLVSAYGFSACLSGLLSAWFIDRFDRKHALLALYAGFTVGTFLCAVAPGYWSLMLARVATGIFGGVLGAIALAIVGDAFPDERRGMATGVVMAGFSVASAAGVPAGLALAGADSPGTPFAVLAGLGAGLLALMLFVVPPIRGHLCRFALRGPVPIWKVLLEPAHLRAFLLSTALVLSTFTIVPYLAAYLVRNVRVPQDMLFMVYFVGGVTTLGTMPAIGWVADRLGKLLVFRVMALLVVVTLLLITNLPVVPLALVLLITTAFWVTTSGRMVPALALINASAVPASRGSFMSINTSVQQMAMGLASLLGGLILGKADDESLTNFPTVGVLSAAATLVSVVLAGQLRRAPESDSPQRHKEHKEDPRTGIKAPAADLLATDC